LVTLARCWITQMVLKVLNPIFSMLKATTEDIKKIHMIKELFPGSIIVSHPIFKAAST